ncbi:MAG: NAD(P)H-hydrate dehydratase, partial [Planctomycetota bacterium]
VHASVTLAFGAPKPGHLFGEGRERSGEVHVLDIGIPPHLAERAVRSKGSALLATDDWVRARLPHRDFDAHKFSAGQVLAVCGSDRYPGAAALASAAAARAGAGYVVCATSERAKDAVDAQCPEVAAVAVERSDAAARALVEEHGRARAVLLGPGLGAPDEESTRAFVRALVESVWDAHLIVDADGLNALADDAGRAALRAAAERLSLAGDGGSDEGCGVVLTPHPGEFARLAGRPASGDPLADARALATDLGAVVVLKGAPTVVATPGKHPPFVAREVEPALATAGSGDVLAGLVAGFAAQNATALEAAVLGVHVGGLAAERACHDRAARSVVASGVVAEVPAALDALEGDRAVR